MDAASFEKQSLLGFFAEALRTDARISEFRPFELQPPGKTSEMKVSDVIGLASTVLTGFGWQSRTKPTKILAFKSCPIILGILIDDEATVKTKFLFNVPANIDPKKWGWLGRGEMKIVGFEGMSGPEKLRFDSLSSETPGLANVRSDKGLHERITALLKTGLVYCGEIKANYENKKPWPYGILELGIVSNRSFFMRGTWRKAIEKANLNPQDFFIDLFTACNSIVRHIQDYFGITPSSS